MDKRTELALNLRDAVKIISDSANAYIDFTVSAEKKNPESDFAMLHFESQKGVKLGDYEVACKASNNEEKWSKACKILKDSKATIQERYHGEGYQYSYWLYVDDRIYRQKLKPKE